MSNEGLKLRNQEDMEAIKNDTVNLRKITNDIVNNHKRRFNKQIVEDNNRYLDSIQLKFLSKNDLEFEEVRLVKKVFDFLKEQE